MAIEIAQVANHLVARDSATTWRWYDAWGPKVSKWELRGDGLGVVTTTTYSGATVTVATSGTLVGIASEDGGGVAFTPAAADNQGIQIQAISENFKFAARWPAYYGVKFKNVDVDQADWICGLCITDTDLLGGTTDGLYFRSVDATAALEFVLEKDSAETSTAVHTCVDATYVTAEWYFDGDNVYCYINDVLAATVAASNANMPDDEHLAPAIALLSGEATANTLSVEWARAIQIREAV
jgi:hypothetical protein